MQDARVPARLRTTAGAMELLRRLGGIHGALMMHQSGGCCDGSSPMCFPHGEFITSEADVLLGELPIDPEAGAEPVEVWMSREQFGYWSHTHLTIDVVPGRGAGFSLEAPLGVRFLIRSRLFTDEESARLVEVTHGG